MKVTLGRPTIHRMHSLKGHNLGGLGVCFAQQLLQVFGVVMAEDEALSSAVPDALNHGGMVPHVRVDLTTCVIDNHYTSTQQKTGIVFNFNFNFKFYLTS